MLEPKREFACDFSIVVSYFSNDVMEILLYGDFFRANSCDFVDPLFACGKHHPRIHTKYHEHHFILSGPAFLN